MTMARRGIATPNAGRRRNRILALCMVTTILLTSILAYGIQTPAPAANSALKNRAPGTTFLDPTAYIYGNHLYDVNNWYIPSIGQNFTLSFPTDWNVTRLGLDFYNGTLQKRSFVNSSTVILNPFLGYITNLRLGQISGSYPNSTIYQAMFNITGIALAESNSYMTVNGNSNSNYPIIDGNIGVAQSFVLSVYAENLSFQVALLKFEGTALNLTAEVRRATSNNNIGELVNSVEVASTAVSLGTTWVTISIPDINLTAGYYFLVLHTDGWLSSGGGYEAATNISTYPGVAPSGWVTSNRGVNWQNHTEIDGVLYYFNGFKLNIYVSSLVNPSPTDINLRINGIPVADNFIWNQSVWIATPLSPSPPSFSVTSSLMIKALNFTYTIWYYYYGTENLFRNGYQVKVNSKPATTSSSGNFTLMRVVLESSDLLALGVMNTTTGVLTLNLKLLNGTLAASGSVKVTAWAQLVKKIDGLTLSGPYTLCLVLIYRHTDPDNVTLSQAAVSIGPISSQIDNVYINNISTFRVQRNLWFYDLRSHNLNITGEAFTAFPQFTMVSGSKLNCTLTVFNNFTASTTITGYVPGTTPSATIRVQNTTPMIDLDGLTSVNITVTNPNGLLINNTELPLVGPYRFNVTVAGEGIYGIRFVSNDTNGHVATRWLGAATVTDITLATPTVILNPNTNLTSNQMLLILTNASYLNNTGIPFSGNLTITISVAGTDVITHLQATWNASAKLYQATYQAPTVFSITRLNILVQATDSKHRISTDFVTTYVLPESGGTIPTIEPSLVGVVVLLIAVVLVLVPALAYLVERYRRRR
jgi:hypothetical protein